MSDQGPEPPQGPPPGSPDPGTPPWQQSFPPPGQPPSAPPGHWPVGAAPGQPPTPQSTNGFAIPALVFGLIPVLPLGIVFGFVALRQIKRSGQAGRGMAIAGIVLSGVWGIVIALVIATIVLTEATRSASGEISGRGDISVEDLRLGDCLNNLEEGTQLSVPAVPCAEPHEAQVYAVTDLEPGPYPGDEMITAETERRCLDLMKTDFPDAFADESVQVFFFHPTSASWAQGDQEIVCVALYGDGPRQGSLLD